MKVYVSAPWIDVSLANAAAGALTGAGFRVVSRWHDLSLWNEHRALGIQAVRDLEDLWDADALLLLNTRLSEGKAVEFGWALSHHLHLVVVGTRSDANIFHYLPEVTMVPTVTAAIEFLRGVD